MLLWYQNMSTPEKQGFDHINIKTTIELVDRIPRLFLKHFGLGFKGPKARSALPVPQAANGHTVAGEDEELVESNAGGGAAGWH